MPVADGPLCKVPSIRVSEVYGRNVGAPGAVNGGLTTPNRLKPLSHRTVRLSQRFPCELTVAFIWSLSSCSCVAPDFQLKTGLPKVSNVRN